VPFQLIAGENDRAGETVSFRFRDGSQENGVPIADAVARIRAAFDDRRQVITKDDL
jgi:threonyl-tRNA synthetase